MSCIKKGLDQMNEKIEDLKISGEKKQRELDELRLLRQTVEKQESRVKKIQGITHLVCFSPATALILFPDQLFYNAFGIVSSVMIYRLQKEINFTNQDEAVNLSQEPAKTLLPYYALQLATAVIAMQGFREAIELNYSLFPLLISYLGLPIWQAIDEYHEKIDRHRRLLYSKSLLLEQEIAEEEKQYQLRK